MAAPVRRVVPSQIASVLLVTGLLFLFVGLYFNWIRLLASVGFPARELSNPWIRADLGVVRGVCVLLGGLLVLSRIALWRYPQAVATSVEAMSSLGSPHPLLVPLTLTVLVLAKTVLQLVLYMLGYSAFSADDFGRPLSAAFWLRYHKFDLGMDGWLGLAGSGWLPFSDFLFAAALAIHQDLFITPRVVNLVLSGLAVASVYLLGSELFGRTVGLVTAALFTFQPWLVWLGMSGMGSDLPSVVLISLFGAFLVRWLRTDKPSALVKAAGFLALANGFRYENWLFALVFSILVACVAFSRWRRHDLTGRRVAVSGFALLLVNALPVSWMAANYVVFGDWLPAMHGINAFMVSFTMSPTPLTETKMGIPLMAVGAFRSSSPSRSPVLRCFQTPTSQGHFACTSWSSPPPRCSSPLSSEANSWRGSPSRVVCWGSSCSRFRMPAFCWCNSSAPASRGATRESSPRA